MIRIFEILMVKTAMAQSEIFEDFTLSGKAENEIFARLEKRDENAVLFLQGQWTLENAARINSLMKAVHRKITPATQINLDRITRLDTAGAVLVRRFADMSDQGSCSVITGLKDSDKKLLDVITSVPPEADTEPQAENYFTGLLIDVGDFTVSTASAATNLLGFIGLTLFRVMVAATRPASLKIAPIVHQIDRIGVRSLGIVGLISFLVGAVMVNQGSIQLEQFGASIFVIDMLGILQFRELGVLLASIIIAGRSGSSFTAQIGSMKIREEVDAMKTLGMNPVDILVLPRLIALTLALPLLTFFADIMGVFGGMLMAWVQLDIQPASFVPYFRDAVTLGDFMVGMIKAPFNALVIVVVGCYQGLTVEGSAESLGTNTTRSVVQSIFLVIVLDAFFAIFFSTIGL